MSRAFAMIDVFGSETFSGNPLAVVHDAEGLSNDEMLTITRWMNLAETAFLLPPSTDEADYRVRIFVAYITPQPTRETSEFLTVRDPALGAT